MSTLATSGIEVFRKQCLGEAVRDGWRSLPYPSYLERVYSPMDVLALTLVLAILTVVPNRTALSNRTKQFRRRL